MIAVVHLRELRKLYFLFVVYKEHRDREPKLQIAGFSIIKCTNQKKRIHTGFETCLQGLNIVVVLKNSLIRAQFFGSSRVIKKIKG